MDVKLKQKNSKPSSNTGHLCGREGCNYFNLRPKTVIGLITSALVFYLLCFLNVAVRVHRLDHIEKNNFIEKRDIARTTKYESTVDHKSIGNGDIGIEQKKNNKNPGGKSKEHINVSAALSKVANSNNDNIIAVNQTLQTIRAEETKSKPEKKKEERMSRSKTRGFKPKPHGHMVSPEIIITETTNSKNGDQSSARQNVPRVQILTAFLEVTDRSAWSSKPLPVRNVTAEDLGKVQYPKLSSCSKLSEQWPVDEFPNDDPFLPWIHDVFPTDDGRFIQFVAQNRRRCHTGTTEEEERILNHNAPQIALFQHVPLKDWKTQHFKHRDTAFALTKMPIPRVRIRVSFAVSSLLGMSPFLNSTTTTSGLHLRRDNELCFMNMGEIITKSKRHN